MALVNIKSLPAMHGDSWRFGSRNNHTSSLNNITTRFKYTQLTRCKLFLSDTWQFYKSVWNFLKQTSWSSFIQTLRSACGYICKYPLCWIWTLFWMLNSQWKFSLLAKLRNLPVFCRFTQILVFFGHVCMVILDVILILSLKVLFDVSAWHGW